MKIVAKEIDVHELSSMDSMSEYIVYIMDDTNSPIIAEEVIGYNDRETTIKKLQNQFGMLDVIDVPYGKTLEDVLDN
jgi:hypothetical protein